MEPETWKPWILIYIIWTADMWLKRIRSKSQVIFMGESLQSDLQYPVRNIILSAQLFKKYGLVLVLEYYFNTGEMYFYTRAAQAPQC